MVVLFVEKHRVSSNDTFHIYNIQTVKCHTISGMLFCHVYVLEELFELQVLFLGLACLIRTTVMYILQT